MARKKPQHPSRRVRRRIRFQQIIFVAFALLLLASFVISLIATP